ncbi:hypothetical protein F4556_000340 [Kitasatospora gansuensis]|uniref:Uncharacterized protein n=1 Tax=Kitasatospora gansuensis TaxID=258050 RepID=A0A7W7WFQ4_9ACTN|nr:hypothetical protein [Kitasatospora gansuensis]MBB4944805.1 hypothetical protein [Kitasatospora gansuensis]
MGVLVLAQVADHRVHLVGGAAERVEDPGEYVHADGLGDLLGDGDGQLAERVTGLADVQALDHPAERTARAVHVVRVLPDVQRALGHRRHVDTEALTRAAAPGAAGQHLRDHRVRQVGDRLGQLVGEPGDRLVQDLGHDDLAGRDDGGRAQPEGGRGSRQLGLNVDQLDQGLTLAYLDHQSGGLDPGGGDAQDVHHHAGVLGDRAPQLRQFVGGLSVIDLTQLGERFVGRHLGGVDGRGQLVQLVGESGQLVLVRLGPVHPEEFQYERQFRR